MLEAVHQAPSVGLMQPWRVVRVTDLALRREIPRLVVCWPPERANLSERGKENNMTWQVEFNVP